MIRPLQLAVFAFLSASVLPAAPPGPILTPPAAAAPRINGPRIFGVRPGSQIVHALAVSGQRPMTLVVTPLPAGLTFDPATGAFGGALEKPGDYELQVVATNAAGSARGKLRIVVGDHIALTPPMGWSSWNCWGAGVSQEKVLSSARAMAASGLREHGWNYVNIDDGWQGRRSGPDLALQPNGKFPDIKSLADEIHRLGLRFGL